ncbi:hypothetical protein K458DRAFT_383371 [Lentithecium fluviatile CBS 122367]|uniref:Flap structure-specific endonuclease n=1 Tax=Lentithecium fluviatile CBS 122367 TaxID=1168545 RepID=A0A6G1JIE8_9PLEO|nr:hypothetical protein K458DRAFT_383371 [Lentithecium fluviatile CBS 122367]
MGIHGIYKEIGPGRRIALSKLAVNKFEETGRPLRIAIDVSIWLFQIQASKGGTNPALRTFYYRLLRLIALSIHPIFVFDGPNKPPFKRNKRTGPNVASIPEFLAKQLLKQFGLPIHLAPGEAEAECALLQREGIVDAVLSEDVDTLMFGSGLTIRNWSPEQKSSKTPTHVNVYDAVETKNGPAGLDREGMILIALMSGGDYVPEGIPGCGPKTACEAARAGFGADLCKIASNDKSALREWRERLQHELKTNESKLFSRKKPSMKIPDDFPRTDILGYYTHPAISTQTGLDKLKRSINWDQDPDFPGLRDFAHDAFDWVKLEGAKHFIRSLAPSLLVRHLRLRAEHADRFPLNDVKAIQEDEALLVKGIHGKRKHAVTDNTTELRVSFTPLELVKIDLSNEEPDEEFDDLPPSSQAPEADLDDDLPIELDDEVEAGPKKRGPTKFDPEKPARVWVLETFVKVGVPLKVQDWEESRQRPLRMRPAILTNDATKAVAKPRRTRRAKTTTDTPALTIDRFAKVTKPGVKLSQALSKVQNAPANPPVASQPASQRSRTIVNLLSSSPVRPAAPPPQPLREKSLSPVPELPSSITKRRRRGPIQRSHTLPSDPAPSLDRPGSPSLDAIETLDLVDLPPLPSPSQLPSKKAKTRTAKPAPTARGTSVPSSPEKTILDAWRSLSATPTKSRKNITPAAAPIHAPPELQISPDEIETLDLTLSSPAHTPPPPQPQPTHPRRTIASIFTSRPPLVSISSNTSQLPSSSTSQASRTSVLKSKSATHATATRRTPPRSRKPASPEIESLDLTQLSSPPPAYSKPAAPPTTTALSSPPPARPSTTTTSALRRSPRAHTSLSPSPPPVSKPSPPAAWKSQAKKKREIRLRKSLAGAWDYVDVESPNRAGGFLREGDDGAECGGVGAGQVGVLKGKERRRWRESEIEILDLS